MWNVTQDRIWLVQTNVIDVKPVIVTSTSVTILVYYYSTSIRLKVVFGVSRYVLRVAWSLRYKYIKGTHQPTVVKHLADIV